MSQADHRRRENEIAEAMAREDAERSEGEKKERELEEQAQEAVHRLFNHVGDIVQITVEETLQALFDAFDDQVVSQVSAPVRTGDLRDALKTVRAHSQSLADRIMERVAKEEDPYGVRHKEEE